MQMFLRFCVFVFLCVVLLYTGGTVDVHAQKPPFPSLTLHSDTDRVYQVNDTVEVVFFATLDGGTVHGIKLLITYSGLTDVVMSNGGVTDLLGTVTVTGKIIADTNVYIAAEWPDELLVARADFDTAEQTAHDAQYPYLHVVGTPGFDPVATVGTVLTVVFEAGDDTGGRSGIPLRITATPNINITSPTPVPGTHRTGPGGLLTVTGTLQRANVRTHIEAFWEVSGTRGLSAQIDIPVDEPSPATTAQAQAVFRNYRDTFRHPDVHEHFPDVLLAFKNPEVQNVLNSVVIHHFVRDPEYIRAFSPNVDASIITLLATDNGFRRLFEDEEFQRLLQEPPEIDELVRFIEAQPPREPRTLTIDDAPAPTLIVVDPPDPKSPLKIGDTFTQRITIENRDSTARPSLPLLAWQMDVVYNPLILEVVEVVEGDFLASDGADTVFYAEVKSEGKISVSQSRRGLAPVGIVLHPGDIGTLLTIQFKILAVAEEALEIHNVRLQSSLDANEDGRIDRISYSILVMDLLSFESPERVVDANRDGDVNILDLVMVASNIGTNQPDRRADVNGDGFVNVLDLVAIYTSEHWGATLTPKKVNDPNDIALAAAPSINRNIGPATIQTWIDLARIEDDGSAIFDLGIANLEALIASRIPTETRLLLNYPNPFNPETWIPYQLAEATDVTVAIHSMNGSLIRTLELGHQAAGTYKSKSQAAYWDGRNAFGERVASGLYFYTLTAGDFTATRKMLIRK